MKTKELIVTLKSTYDRSTRKLLVKNMIEQEMSNDAPDYKLIDQIFSYVISECSWKLADNSNKWDNTPIKVMQDSFPNIENTKWYKAKSITVSKCD